MKKKDPWRNVSGDKFTLIKQLKEVTAQRDLLLAALEKVEWVFDAFGNKICGWCHEESFGDHAHDCQRDAAIALAVKGERGEDDAQSS